MVSVIVPIYKVEKYLPYCIESIINQTYENLEIILVDDGSPDGCPRICDEYAKKDKRIKVIHKKNGGLSSARNAGLDIFTGEYVVFIDSDDMMINNAIELMIKELINNKSDLVMTDYYYLKSLDENPNIDNSNYIVENFEGNDIFDLLYNKKYPMIMLAWAKLYKKDLFKNIRFPEGKIHEDDFIIHRVLDKTKKFTHMSSLLFLNSLRPESITASKFTPKRFDAIDAKLDRVNYTREIKPEYYQATISQLLKTIIINYTFARMSKIKKQEIDKILIVFNEYYKKLEKKNVVIFMFKHFRQITYLLLKQYVKKKKLLYTN